MMITVHEYKIKRHIAEGTPNAPDAYRFGVPVI